MPTEAEIKQVDTFDGDPMTLADCDQFVLLMGTSPGYQLRLKSILFKSSYKQESEDILKKIERFYLAFDFVKESKTFHGWLEVILAFGNYLNGTSNRGGAYGFKLDALPKLNELKTSDNKRTLLYYIIEYIGENKMEDLLKITTELEVFNSRKIINS
jgi:diaphanous 1